MGPRPESHRGLLNLYNVSLSISIYHRHHKSVQAEKITHEKYYFSFTQMPILQERKIRRHFNLKGKCSEPRQLEGLDIVALPPRKFKCEPPSFVDKHKDIIVNAALGDPAWLPCAPDHGLPPPDIQWKFRKKVRLFRITNHGCNDPDQSETFWKTSQTNLTVRAYCQKV